MIPPPFRYLRPGSIDDALTMLAQVDGAVVLGGGQSLVNALKLDLVSPAALVDVHRLPELSTISEGEGDGGIRVGAAVTYARLAADPIVREHVPSLAEVAAGLVDRQVRNRGTIGGNCCLNDPTNNLPPLLAALDASFEVARADEPVRTLSADQFFRGTLRTAAAAPALLVAVRVPRTGAASRVAYRHQQVGADSWALARAVVRVDVVDERVDVARVFLGAVPNSPLRLAHVELALLGLRLGPETQEAALAAFDRAPIDVVGDSHGSPTYRRAMARVQLKRALSSVSSKTTSEDVA